MSNFQRANFAVHRINLIRLKFTEVLFDFPPFSEKPLYFGPACIRSKAEKLSCEGNSIENWNNRRSPFTLLSCIQTKTTKYN